MIGKASDCQWCGFGGLNCDGNLKYMIISEIPGIWGTQHTVRDSLAPKTISSKVSITMFSSTHTAPPENASTITVRLAKLTCVSRGLRRVISTQNASKHGMSSRVEKHERKSNLLQQPCHSVQASPCLSVSRRTTICLLGVPSWTARHRQSLELIGHVSVREEQNR